MILSSCVVLPDIDTPLKIEFVSIKETFTSVPSSHHLRCFSNIFIYLPAIQLPIHSNFTVKILVLIFGFWILVSYCLLGSAWLHGSFSLLVKTFSGENSAETEACHVEIWFFLSYSFCICVFFYLSHDSFLLHVKIVLPLSITICSVLLSYSLASEYKLAVLKHIFVIYIVIWMQLIFGVNWRVHLRFKTT